MMNFDEINRQQNPQQYQGMYGYPVYNTTYNQNVQKAKMTTGLTPEQIKEMRSLGAEKFSLNLTEEEQLKCRCFHKDNGNIVVNSLGDGYVECPICHEKFYAEPLSQEEVEAAVSKVISIAQMIKTYYLDCPDNAVEFFYVIALVSRLPKLYEIAMKDFNKHLNGNGLVANTNQPSTFNLYNNMVNPASYYNGFQQPPMMQAGFNPMFQQQQMMQAGFNPAYQQQVVGQQGYIPAQQQGGFITSPNNMTQNVTAGQGQQQATQTVTPSTVAGDTVQQGLQ